MANPRAIFSKTGKGVQEASGKTSHLSRADRAVLKEIDGKTTLGDVALKFDKIPADKFDALIQQLDKDGFVREVSSGASAEPITPLRRTPPPPPKAVPPKAAPPPSPSDDGGGLDFTQAISLPPRGAPAAPKGPAVDLAAASRAEAERKAKEQAAVDYRARQEAEAKAAAEAKAKAEAEARARAAAEAKAKAEAEAKAKAEAEAKAKAEIEAKAKAEAEAKAKQARDMALRMASEAKAKAEAEAKDKARLEAELKGKLEEERKAREDAEKRAAEASERARKELEEKTKLEAEEMRRRLEAEMKAKLEEERRAREEEDRKRREEEDRRRKEEHEQREKEHAERRAKEEAERKQREAEDRKRREEEDRRRKEEDERRAKEETERKQREAEDRKRREEEERRRKEEDERREKERAERHAREEGERKRREEDDRRRREESERRAKEESERKSREPAAAPPPAPPAAASGGGDFGSLLDDLDSFGQKEEEERKAKEEAERKAKQEAEARARAEEERKRREEEERKRRAEEERRAKAEAERKTKDEEERREREDEERRKEAEAERKRKAQEEKQAEERAAAQRAAGAAAAGKAPARAGAKDEEIGVSDDDLDMDDVKRDEAAVSKEARKVAKDREEAVDAAMRPVSRPRNWGKPVALALFVVLAGGVGALHIMPLSTTDYEKAASEALGAPVKVSSARLSVLTGVKVNLEGVAVGDTKIGLVRGFPEIGSLFGPKKVFSRIELEGADLSQAALGQAMFGKVSGDNFRVGRIVLKSVKLDGPLTLPPLDVDAVIGGDGSVQVVNIGGPDKLAVRITPSGENISFEASAGSLALPFVPALSLADFGWKGTANRQGITQSEFDGRAFDGLISGTARVRWGANWTVEGEVRSRGVKVAVFAPTLVSDGKVEGRASYTMSGPAPSKLGESARIDGSFKIENGVIGNFDLGRALQTGGSQTQGRTEFAELSGQGVYDKGTVQLRNLSITSRAMSAGASLDIDAGGSLNGRIAAEVKTPNQTLRAVLNIAGSLQNPVVKK